MTSINSSTTPNTYSSPSALKDFSTTCQISTGTILSTAAKENFRDVLWTTEIKKELPVFVTKDLYGSLVPRTIMEIFEEAVRENPKEECLFIERKGEWVSWTWNHYQKEVLNFAKALINIGIEPYKTVNILGCNSPEWFAAFLGGIYACVIPTGVYLTNNSEACVYMAEHSECGCLVLDSIEQYKKYEKDLAKLKSIKAIVFYCELTDEELKGMINPYVTIYRWSDFIELGKKANNDLEFNQRVRMQNPGNCCSIVYTSGTTGHPKAVLLSHDNLTWTGGCLIKRYVELIGLKNKIVSYLPLSHIAGIVNDLIMTTMSKSIVYFARPDALSGSLLGTLHYVRPTAFFAVPRVYEKFEERIREQFNNAGFIKKKLIKFSQKTGTKYIDNLIKNKGKPFMYPVINAVVFKKIKKALGLENARVFAYGAAPMKKQSLDFFKSLGLGLVNFYGMSESTGPTFSNLEGSPIELGSAGIPIPGSDCKIVNPDNDGVGEICFRGRNRFMGYSKNETATVEAIDSDGFLHSGDQGYINKNGNLLITGRLKELIVTAGGENVAPLPIEDLLKELCKILSTVVILGDDKKYLAALLTLKTDQNGNLTKEVLDFLKEIGSQATNTIEALNCDKIKFYVQKSIDEANKKAISRAQLIRKWTILPNEFSIEGGELTPTMKIKRKFVSQKYSKVIDKMYSDPKF